MSLLFHITQLTHELKKKKERGEGIEEWKLCKIHSHTKEYQLFNEHVQVEIYQKCFDFFSIGRLTELGQLKSSTSNKHGPSSVEVLLL